MPPESEGLGHVALRVRDLRAMEAFYVGQLGLAVTWREGTEAKPSEVDAAHRLLEAAGTRVTTPPAQDPHGVYAAEVVDPEGNAVMLFSR